MGAMTSATDTSAQQGELPAIPQWAVRDGCPCAGGMPVITSPDQPRSTCNALEAANCLHLTTLAVLSRGGGDADRLRAPLSQLVSRLRTREGHADCARFALALERGDYTTALDSCRRLIARQEGERPGAA